jgi:HSP20 family protein
MASIVRWEPFRDMMAVRDAMDRMFEERLVRAPVPPWGPWAVGAMPVDMYETDETVVVKAPIPGVKAGEIEVSITGDTLTIKAEIKEEDEVSRENYLRRERRYGSCCRSVTLPGGLETEQAEADYSEGVLTLIFPKMEEVRSKTIEVKTS